MNTVQSKERDTCQFFFLCDWYYLKSICLSYLSLRVRSQESKHQYPSLIDRSISSHLHNQWLKKNELSIKRINYQIKIDHLVYYQQLQGTFRNKICYLIITEMESLDLETEAEPGRWVAPSNKQELRAGEQKYHRFDKY